jgi:ferredoxin-NADP reductase
MLTLLLRHPVHGERRIELDESALRGDGVIIGRSQHARIILDDGLVSRVHARLSIRHEALHIEDLASSTGTLVNGRRIMPGQSMRLGDGDSAVVGGYVFCLEIPVASDGTPMPTRTARPESYMPVAMSPDGGWPRWSSGQMTMQVVRVIEEAREVKTFVFASDPPLLFHYLPGQFVTLILDLGGKTVRRSYTLSSSPSRPHLLSITVKRVPAAGEGLPPGLVSNWLHDHLCPGHRLTINGPFGDFSCLRHPDPRLLLISAGVGITPMLSMARWLTDTAAAVDTVFLHSSRSHLDLICRRDVELLSVHNPLLRPLLLTTRPEAGAGWTGLGGHLDPALLKSGVPDFLYRRVFCCGPDGFMLHVKEMLRDAGFPMDRYHQESFGARRRPVPLPTPDAITPPRGVPLKGPGDNPSK